MRETTAVVFSAPGQIALKALALIPSDDQQALVDVQFSGISTGTERLLWSGDMPAFPGMGYPLVPGYETVGRVAQAPETSGLAEGDLVFVPGANCYGPVRGLFGGAAKHIAITPQRLTKIPEKLAESGVMLALAATAHHAITVSGLPDLIVGHGTLGRLIARIAVAMGGAPTVWENQAQRRGNTGYTVLSPDEDARKDYRCAIDASGDPGILDRLMQHVGRHGQITLAGFYSKPLSFMFAPAFMREASIRIAAQWQPDDLIAVLDLIGEQKLSLDGLITHRHAADAAENAYDTAFQNPDCLKMVLDWSTVQ